MKHLTILAIGLTLAAAPQKRDDAERWLEAAVQAETVDGDLTSAIEQYKKIIAKPGATRDVVAKALVRLGICYERQGNSDARKQYERVLREYADEKEAAAMARSRLNRNGAGGPGALSQRLLCSDCGDYEANISADGRFIVYTDYSTGDLVIRDLSTGHVRRMMAKSGTYKESMAYAEAPSLSSDLRQVAYIWQTGTGGRDLPTELRVTANELGGRSRVLLESNAENRYYEPLGWSADGKSILALVAKSDRTWQIAWVSAANGALKPIKSLQWRLSGGVDPKLSPDGRYIAYGALAANPSKPIVGPIASKDKHIYVLAADGSGEAEVVKTAGLNSSPVWTPDGKHILFLSDRSGSTGLWSVAVENGKADAAPVLVSSNLGAGSTFSSGVAWPMGVTPSGSYYYILERAGLEQISVVRSGTAGKTDSFVGMQPSWSPDGKSIAFKRHHPGSNSYDLVVHSLATGEERMYPTDLGTTGAGQPLWLPDGKSMLIALAREGSLLGEYRVDVESGEYKKMSDAATHPFGLQQILSQNGQVHYVATPSAIVAHVVTTGVNTPILNTPGDGRTAMALSPDGRTLAVWRSDFQARQTFLATVSVDGSNFRKLCDLDFTAYGGVQTPAWSEDGKTVLFAQRHEKTRQIMRVSADGGTPEFTGIEADGDIHSITVSREGLIAYSSTTKTALELWALDHVLAGLK